MVEKVSMFCSFRMAITHIETAMNHSAARMVSGGAAAEPALAAETE